MPRTSRERTTVPSFLLFMSTRTAASTTCYTLMAHLSNSSSYKYSPNCERHPGVLLFPHVRFTIFDQHHLVDNTFRCQVPQILGKHEASIRHSEQAPPISNDPGILGYYCLHQHPELLQLYLHKLATLSQETIPKPIGDTLFSVGSPRHRKWITHVYHTVSNWNRGKSLRWNYYGSYRVRCPRQDDDWPIYWQIHTETLNINIHIGNMQSGHSCICSESHGKLVFMCYTEMCNSEYYKMQRVCVVCNIASMYVLVLRGSVTDTKLQFCKTW